MEVKKLASAGLNVPFWLLIYRLAGCQWWEINRSGQPSPLKSATAVPKDQSDAVLMPAAVALSVIVTGIGVVGGGVFGGGFGAGPTPGAVGTGGTGAAARVGSETGPEGQLACSMSGLGPSRPTTVSDEPAGLTAMPTSWSSAEPESAETTVVHAVPSKCTTS